jgi:hypothetical protein
LGFFTISWLVIQECVWDHNTTKQSNGKPMRDGHVSCHRDNHFPAESCKNGENM